MFHLGRPSDEEIRSYLEAQGRLPFAYPEVGHTRRGVPPGYPVNHHRARLGAGPDTFARAVAALRDWAMYRLSWTELFPAGAPVRQDTPVAAVVHHFGFWSVNPCRIVYVEEERGEVDRFAFAIGTLPGHGERGEERFSVEWRHADGSVWFDLFAFAGPNHPLTRAGLPLLRMLQRRFGRQALEAVRTAARSPGS